MRISHQMQRDELFTQTEKTVRDFLLEQQESIHSLSAEQIARKNYVSKATLTRFAKKLGFSGWNAFKLAFVRELARSRESAEPVDTNFPYNELDDIKTIADRLHALKINTLAHCFSTIEPDEISRALSLIESRSRIHVFAKGYSLLASEDFCLRMIRLGKPISCNNEAGMLYIARSMTSRDLAIVVSYTGRTEAVVESFRILLRNNVPTIAITNEDPNPIGDNATVSLPLPREERTYSKLGNFHSVDSIRAIFDVLYSGYAAKNPDSLAERIDAAKQFDPKL